MRYFRGALTIAAFAVGVASLLAQSSAQLSAFPSMSVADTRSTTTVTATVRDPNGQLVRDGTRVAFTTNLGTFRENVVTTAGGVARAVLVSGGVPGIATITAIALAPNAAPSTMQFEFVANRQMLASAQEYIEVVTGGAMQYSNDDYNKLMSASSPNKGVNVRYRDVEVTADDVQIDIPNSTLRAKRAHLKFGKIDQDFEELFLRLGQRKGFGTTSFVAHPFEYISFGAHGLKFTRRDWDDTVVLATDQARFGVVEITGGTFKPSNQPIANPVFQFEDTSASPSTVRAKKAIIFPRKGIQFQKAEVYVGPTKVISMPLFELNMYATSSPIITDQFVSVENSKLAVNYPYYLTLKPGLTSLMRLRTGQVYGRGTQAVGGLFLDYELNWNKGDSMDGGMNVGGIGRDDWSLGLHQYLRLDDRSSASVQAEFPAAKSMFGSLNYSRQFDGFQVNFNGSHTRSLRGTPYQNQDVNFSAEKDPTKLGSLPVRLYYGLSAMNNSNSLINRTQSGAGIYTRLQTQSLPVGKGSFNAAFTTRRLFGDKETAGVSLNGEASLVHPLGRSTVVTATYNYVKDRYDDQLQGHHRLSLSGSYSAGRLGVDLYGTKSLDVDRMSVYGNASYRFNRSWRFATSYTYDSYPLGGSEFSRYLDLTLGLNYRIGWRDVGVIWSQKTRRLGLQIVAASGN